jgi:hypothetical protein
MAVCEMEPAEFERRHPELAEAVLGPCRGALHWYEAHIKIDAAMGLEANTDPISQDTSGYRCERHLKLLAATRLRTRSVP